MSNIFNAAENLYYPLESEYIKTSSTGDTTITGSLFIDAAANEPLQTVLKYNPASKLVSYGGLPSAFDQSLNTTDSPTFKSLTLTTLNQQGGEVPNPQIVVCDILTQEIKFRDYSSLPNSTFDQSLNTTDSPTFVNLTLTGDLQSVNSVATDTIIEKTLDAGVTIDGLVVKDGGMVSIEGQTNIHSMDQPVRTTDSPTFGNLTLNGVGNTCIITNPYLRTTAANGIVSFELTAPPVSTAYRQFVYNANAPNGCSGFTIRNSSTLTNAHSCVNALMNGPASNGLFAMYNGLSNFTWMAGMRTGSDQYIIGRKTGISDELQDFQYDKLRLLSTGVLQVDSINEIVLDAGVTIEGVVLKDNSLTLTPTVGANEDVLTITPGGLIQKQDQETITKKITLNAFNGEAVSTVDIITVGVPIILQNIATAGNLIYNLGSDFTEAAGIVTYNGLKSVICQLVFTSSIAGSKDRDAKMSIFKNGAQLVCSYKTISTLTYYDTMTATIITTLNTGDTLSLRLQNETDNTDFNIRCTTLSLLGII